LHWAGSALPWPIAISSDDLPLGYNRGLLPVGYRGLILVATGLLGEHDALRIVPLALQLAALLGIWWAARSLGGPLAGIASLLLPLTTRTHVLSDVALSIPRSFGTPLLAIAAALLIRGNTTGLAVVTLLGALFYPVVGLTVGFALTLLLLVVPARLRGAASAWGLRRRLAVVALTALLSALAILPPIETVQRWGPTIRSDDVAEFPELGPRGRLWAGDRVPFESALARIRHESSDLLLLRRNQAALVQDDRRRGSPVARWLPVILLALLAAAIVLATREESAARFLCLPAAALVAFWLSRLAPPLLYLPPRHLTYVAPVVLTLLWGAIPVALLRKLGGTRVAAWGILPLAIWLVLFGVELPQTTRESIHRLSPAEMALHRFAASTDPEARFAGFPRGTIDQIPFYGRRRVLMSLESHNPYHRRYVLEMRRRFATLAEALYGPRQEALLRLREEFGVRYLLLDRRDFERPPKYFEPFSTELAGTWSAGERLGFASRQAEAVAAVFRRDPFTVLDLDRLATAPAGSPTSPEDPD